MRNSLFLLLLFCFLCIFSCKEELPKGIIPESEMEEILYDFHLVQTMNMPHAGKETDLDEVMKAFYEKYHITQEDFDTSMSYYSKDLEHLNEMYERISKRFDEETTKAGLQINNEKTIATISVSGDTLDVWNKSRICLLTPSRLNHLYTFQIQADSTFHQHDLFHLLLNSHFLIAPTDAMKDSGTPPQTGLTLGLVVQYENDSISSSIRSVYSTQKVDFMLKADSAFNIKMISGFFSLPAKNSVPVLIDGISLLKLHTRDISAEINDDLEVVDELEMENDSVESDLPLRRLSPQEMRNNRPVEHKVRIRKR